MLDARKLARMAENRARMRRGRTRTVTVMYRRPEGTAYVAADVVWRAQPYGEPVATAAGMAAGRAGEGVVAVRAEFPPELDPRRVALVAETDVATPEAVAAAPRYAVLRYRPAGIATNRWAVELERLR